MAAQDATTTGADTQGDLRKRNVQSGVQAGREAGEQLAEKTKQKVRGLADEQDNGIYS